MRTVQAPIADFEGKGGAEGCVWLPQTEKGKEMDSPESLPIGLSFPPVRLIQTSDL